MSGVQIFTESPISSAVKNEQTTTTASADPPQPAQAPSTLPPPSSAAFAPQPTTFLPAEPSVNPPTPTTASHPQPQPVSSYIPPTSAVQPPRSNSLTPSMPGSPSNLDAPFVPRSRSTSPRRDIPPPPKAGEKMKPASYYSPAATPTYANQSASYGQFPPPAGQTPNTATFAQQQQGLLSPHPNGLFSPAYTPGGNMTASPAQTPTTATIPAFQGQNQPANFEHPPGYVQNPYAADMTPEQRFASQHGARSPSLGYNDAQGGFKSPNVFSNFAASSSGTSSPGVSTGGGRGGILDNGNDDGSVWGVVSGWAKTAGKKIGEVEGEVWKRINGDQ